MTTVTSVGVSVTQLIKKPPNPVKEAVIAAILNGTSIIDGVRNTLTSSLTSKSKQYYNYGKKHNLLAGERTNDELTVEKEEAVLAVLYNENSIDPTLITHDVIEIQSAVLSTANANFFGGQYLFDTYGIDVDPNYNGIIDVGLPTSEDTYVYGMDIVSNGILEITFIHDVPNPDPQEIPVEYTPIQVSIPSIILDGAIYYHVYYTVTPANGDPAYNRYWIYNVASKIYSSLAPNRNEELTGLFYPVAALILDKQKIDKTVDAASYTTTNKLLKIVGIDLEDTLDSILDSDNADLDKMDDAFIIFGLNLNSTEQAALDYIWNHFKYLKDEEANDPQLTFRSNKEKFDIWFAGNRQFRAPTVITRFESRINSFSERLKVTIEYNYIDVSDTIITSSPNTVGNITKQFIITDPYSKYGRDEFAAESSTYKITKQISDTVKRTYTVKGLRHQTQVTYNKATNKTLETARDGDKGFYIPMSPFILNNLSVKNKSEALYLGVTLVITAIEQTKLKWYQEPTFLSLVQYVFIYIAIITFDVGGWTKAIEAGFQAVLKHIAEEVVLNYAISVAVVYVIGEVLQLLGIEIGLITALILVAAAVYTAYTGINIKGLPNAEQLMGLSTLVIKSINNVVKDDFLELVKESEEFLKSSKEQQEEIDKAWDLLGENNLDPYTLLRGVPLFIENETPTAYYNRTIHTTNPGVQSLEAVYNYVAGALQLPQTNDLTNYYV
jgi:hypothetical protein